MDRDISEIERILDELDEDRLAKLREVILSRTEETES